jgi:hypothetical protein
MVNREKVLVVAYLQLGAVYWCLLGGTGKLQTFSVGIDYTLA